MDKKNELFENIKNYLLDDANRDADGRIETETELAIRFNTSRYKVRQALGTLVQMGMLERAPRRGSVLKNVGSHNINNQLLMQFDLSGFDISEFIEARILIECAIIPLATRRIFPAMLSKLENELRLIEENADNPQEADRHDRDFHLLLLQASGNRVLQVFSDVLITYFEKTRESLPANDRQYFIDTATKQREILAHIKKGDAQAASELMRAHLLEKRL
ncbi:TPA: FadR family transcriptional regulator [Citrobacter freundii]|nr:FadR family transcriptional regulator [Citrobacter freundii]